MKFEKGQKYHFPDHMIGRYRKKTITTMVKMPYAFSCESREGILSGEAGDYLVADDYGGFYPVGAKFHTENYEQVREEQNEPN